MLFLSPKIKVSIYLDYPPVVPSKTPYVIKQIFQLLSKKLRTYPKNEQFDLHQFPSLQLSISLIQLNLLQFNF